MAKITYSTAIQNTSDATFQAWADELYAGLIAAGLVQTTDTGQLSVPVAAPLPAFNSAAGYWVFRFDDSLQGSAPLFLKFRPGRGSSTSSVQIWLSVGTGTSGAGTLTGVVMPEQTMCNGASIPGANPAPTYINHDEGFFGLAFKCGAIASQAGVGFAAVCRTTDDAGDPTGAGYFCLVRTSGSAAYASSGVFGGYGATATDKSWCCPPFPGSSSAVGSDYQAYKVYGVLPAARIVPQLVAALAAELPLGNQTGPVDVMDGVTRNYIATGPSGWGMTAAGASNYQLCMKWD